MPLVRCTVVAIAFALGCSSSEPPPPCTATTCRSGCCDHAGVCQNGRSRETCGVDLFADKPPACVACYPEHVCDGCTSDTAGGACTRKCVPSDAFCLHVGCVPP